MGIHMSAVNTVMTASTAHVNNTNTTGIRTIGPRVYRILGDQLLLFILYLPVLADGIIQEDVYKINPACNTHYPI